MKKRVLLISDVPGWAFDQNMQDLAITLADEFSFEHWYVIDYHRAKFVPPVITFDAIFRVFHLSVGAWNIDHLLPWDRALGALRSQWWDTNKQEPMGLAEFATINKYRGFQVCCEQNYLETKDHCPNVRLLTNPVRLERFTAPPPTERLIAEWNGNAQHNAGNIKDVKGLFTVIQPACLAAGVELQIAEYNTRRLAPAQMPAFYAGANVALVASLYEGSSNSFREAMAAGLAVITTDCGDARDTRDRQLADYGDTGIWIVERTEQAFMRALLALKKDLPRVQQMGELNRRAIADRWSWQVWKKPYSDLLKLAM
jgi:glycosyltransferase involved in cell wall biosynthesis